MQNAVFDWLLNRREIFSTNKTWAQELQRHFRQTHVKKLWKRKEVSNLWIKMHDKGEELAITEDEAALYDRQIRLWGLDAQRRWG